MAEFGEQSKKALESAHPDLRKLFEEVVKTFDCAVICGFRNAEDQDKAFIEGRSKVQYPNSKHNNYPSDAVDVVPYPIVWPAPNQPLAEYTKNVGRFYMFIGYVLATAQRMGIKVRSGGDWNGDMEIKDQNWDDLPHWERVT